MFYRHKKNNGFQLVVRAKTFDELGRFRRFLELAHFGEPVKSTDLVGKHISIIKKLNSFTNL